MTKKNLVIIFCLILSFFLVSSVGGFGINANKDESTPAPNDQREYTRANSTKPVGQGGYYGGHDTFTNEAALLKQDVHRNDSDSGEKFKSWMNIDALPNLRTGAHDEDSTKVKLLGITIPLDEAPIGPNGDGNFFEHFYNPDKKKGLWTNDSAVKRIKNYITEINKKVGCNPTAINNLSPTDKQKVYDLFGRIGHLIQDMGIPSHVKDEPHVLEQFEKYVNDKWSEIVNSQAFKESVTEDKYLNGNYQVGDASNPEAYMDALANISKQYYTNNDLFTQADVVGQPPIFHEEKVKENADKLIPEVIKYTAGYIDAMYKTLAGNTASSLNTARIIMLASLESDVYTLAQLFNGASGGSGMVCQLPPPEPESPAGDTPDDRFDVSDEYYWEKEFKLTDYDLTNLYLRTAIKKGKIGVWYKKLFMEKYAEGKAKLQTATQEEINNIEAEFQNVWQKLQQRSENAESEWRGAPDIALFANGFYKPSISLMLKISEPVSFQKADFDPQIVKDHPVMLVPSGGFYGLENSAIVKASLEEYVKNGGTLVVLSQQHGADWGLLPAPIDPITGLKKSVTGYGYQEDQSCQFNSVYIDTYHPMLSVFSTSTANIGVDGYFTSYPENSTIFLRRTANGQPAMIMYPYGNGYVIATTLYTDFALSHSQANQTEINLVQNIISYAKKPDTLVEVKPGQIANVNVTISNFTDTSASAVKFIILDPSRTAISTQQSATSVPAGQAVTIPVSYTSSSTASLGIYHVDYILLDAQGNIIQPQAETDSGRFAESNLSVNKNFV